MKLRLVVGGAACVVAAALLIPLTVGGATPTRSHTSVRAGRTAPSARPAASGARSTSAPAQLAGDIDRAQATIDDPSSTSAQLASAGLLEQLATVALEREPISARRTTLGMLGVGAAASMHANLDAAAALSGLVVAQKHFPHWKVVSPPPPAALLGYFQAAQSQFGVPWEYLAAIEFIETKFGRVQGLSSAGAEGPMQFLPATWARYGKGNVDNPRDAILGAARYLVANGAPSDMAQALYHYNNSSHYVRAVGDYAGRMRADPLAFDGYYYWQVLYAHVGGTVILPVGYPRLRPVPIETVTAGPKTN